MQTQQILIAVVCIFLASQGVAAVVNNAQTNSPAEADANGAGEGSSYISSSSNVADSVAASSDKVATRLDSPVGDAYGPPIPHDVFVSQADTYAPTSIEFPVPVYGVPDSPGNNIVYPAPPPDIPPPPSSLSIKYGPPADVYGPPKDVYGPPIDIYGPPKDGPPKPIYGPPPPKFNIPHRHISKIPKPFPPFHKPVPHYGPPKHGPLHHKSHFKFPKNTYGPPKLQYGPPKPHFGHPKPHLGPLKLHGIPPSFHERPNIPKDIYGPPKDVYGPPKDVYGPPKDVYGPPKDVYGPPKDVYGPPKDVFGPPKEVYGPPKEIYGPPLESYGPPKEIYGPPKEVYGPPKDAYGPPPKEIYGPPKEHFVPPINFGQQYGPPIKQFGGNFHFEAPNVGHGPPHPGIPAPPTPPDIKYDGWQPIPGLVSRPPHGEAHGDHFVTGDFIAPPITQGVQSLSLGSSYGNSAGISDSYGAPLNTVTGSGGVVSTSGDAHIHNQDQSAISLGLSAAGIGSAHDGQLSVVKSIGYEIFPQGGASRPVNHNAIEDTYSAPPLNSYDSNGPYAASHSYKNNGITSSFSSAHSSGKGFSFSSTGVGLVPPSGLYGIPPSSKYGTPLISSPPKHPVVFREPVPHGLIQSIGNSVAEKDAAGIIENSNTFSGATYIPPPVPDLPFKNSPKLTNLYSLPLSNSPVSFSGSTSHSFNFDGAHAAALTSYNAPPHGGITVGLDHSLSASNIDLTHLGVSSFAGGIPDCHKSQLPYQGPPPNFYPEPSNSNIGGSHFGYTDLQEAHSQETSVSNLLDDSLHKNGAKSLAQNHLPSGEVLQSQSIDLNNIPIQGSLGSYTLQIQSANGNVNTQVPHDQVLNDGLLQSILAAIEQPQQKDVQYNGQPLFTITSEQNFSLPHLSDELQLANSGIVPRLNAALDDEPQDSLKSSVVVLPDNQNVQDQESSAVSILDNNEIALYFHNSSKDGKEDADDGSVRNGQQYGSYVSVQTANTNYTYGDLNKKV